MIDFGKLIDQYVPSFLMPKTGSNRRTFPFFIHLVGATVTCALLIPPVIVWRSRTAQSRAPRIHIFHDMDHQQKYKAQSANNLFVDGRGMRKPVAGTVARGEIRRDTHFFEGRVNGQWAVGLPANRIVDGRSEPLVVDEAFIARGEDRYGIFCQPCHGADGHGQGPVTLRAMNGNPNIGTAWTEPTNLHTLPGDPVSPAPVEQPLGQLFNSITHGVRNMPAYGRQISVEDRWAILAYVRVLQRSQNPNP